MRTGRCAWLVRAVRAVACSVVDVGGRDADLGVSDAAPLEAGIVCEGVFVVRGD
jgi:hypothetical protein